MFGDVQKNKMYGKFSKFSRSYAKHALTGLHVHFLQRPHRRERQRARGRLRAAGQEIHHRDLRGREMLVRERRVPLPEFEENLP